MTDIDRQATRPAAALVRLPRKALAYELRMWRSLFRWILRRHRAVGPDARIFRYAGTVTPVMLAFIAVSAIEMPILHLLLPWPTVRTVLLVLSIYGLLWMVGLLASVRAYPHVVSDAGLRVRNGTTVDTTIPWTAVAAIRARHRGMPKNRSVQFDRTSAGLAVNIAVMSQTNVDVTLREPTALVLPKGDGEPAIELRLYADDPAAFVARARHHLSDRPEPSRP